MSFSVQCGNCKNVDLKEGTCKAFNNGVPREILTGEHDHKTKYKGDNGIQIEPIEDD